LISCIGFFSPITYAWHGGTLLGQDSEFSNMLVSREEYEEEGRNSCFDKFDV
jgi:actin-related protein 6